MTLDTREKYRRSPDGLLRRMFARQKASSKQRDHQPPSYSFEELKQWAYNNGFNRVYTNWKKNNFKKGLTPSIDRLNDNKPYTIDNLYRVCTWLENKKRGENMRRLLAPEGKPVKQIDKSTLKVITNYKSISWASRKTNIPASNICKVLKGKLKSAGGYIWEYV